MGTAGQGARVMLWPLQWLQDRRGSLFPWLAVLIGLGIGLWFSQPVEPGAGSYALAALVLAGGIALAWRGPDLAAPLGLAAAGLAAGWLAAGIRAHSVAAPMLEFRYYGPVEGRIVDIDRSQSDALRLTLDSVVLREVPPERTPARVRVSLPVRTATSEPQAASCATPAARREACLSALLLSFDDATPGWLPFVRSLAAA